MVIDLKDVTQLDNRLVDTFLEKGWAGNELIEKVQQVSLPYAELKAKEWYFDGIRIGYAEWQYREPSVVEWEFDTKFQIITLYFNLKGRTKTGYGGRANGKAFELGNYQHNLFYAPFSKGELRNEDLRLTTFMIQFSLPAFLALAHNANDALQRFCENVGSGRPVALSDQNLYLDAGMHRAIEAILTCRYAGGLKKLFLLSKCMELLVMQAEAYNLSLGAKAGYVKTGYDKERLLYAREYLKQHVESPPSLPELSRILGINEYKLKKGFKELFGNTVFGYLADLRLDMARDYLLEKKKPASEIAFDLGYSSVQHFSTAFKNKFGVSPRAFSAPKPR